MSVNIERKKQLEAMAYFTRHTKQCGAVKMFKLLYFLDMLHFRETGRPVTGLVYTALPYGPVPLTLHEELKTPSLELAEEFRITGLPPREDGTSSNFLMISPKKPESDLFLTAREKRIAHELAEMFYEANADDMSQVSHAKGGPWEKARDKNPGHWVVPIDFFDATNPTLKMGTGKLRPKAELQERAAEYDEVRRVFR